MSIAIAASAAALAVLYLSAAGAAIAGLNPLHHLPFFPREVAGLATVVWAATGFFLALASTWLFRRSGGTGRTISDT